MEQDYFSKRTQETFVPYRLGKIARIFQPDEIAANGNVIHRTTHQGVFDKLIPFPNRF